MSGWSSDPSAADASPAADTGGGAPRISLPKGGGAIRGVGETFSARSMTGTASLTIPISTSPGRSGFGPALSLSYDSGAGNGPFGLGWSLSLPTITRKTDKGLPRYADAAESDVFLLSGVEDLAPVLIEDPSGAWIKQGVPPRNGYRIIRYRPRIESPFSRIERWTRESDGDTYWRVLSRDNVTSFYGLDEQSRIADPADPGRVFSWLICQSQDDRGNAILYSYVAEDGANVDSSLAQERNRAAPGRRSANRYPSRIRYGNTQSLLVQPDLTQQSWLFEIVFDHGEGYLDVAAPDAQGQVFASATLAPTGSWPVRQDPFSHYRATFEVRSYRLCRRVLMFHHFAELGVADCLVRSTEFEYQEGPVASLLTGATQSGYARQADGRYLRKSLPRLELSYTAAALDDTVRDLSSESLANLPRGVDGAAYQWLDLDSEGLAGVLTEQSDGWYYKRNLGGVFGPVERVAARPAITSARAGRQQFLDLAGNGHLDLVQFDGAMAGFQERNRQGGWCGFTPFRSRAEFDRRDPNLRFIDVTGDGFPDILISEDTVLTWYQSRARGGFAPPLRTPKGWDEETGPALAFSDPTHAIFFADMTGDGLTDIVRIRCGEVCYWPNRGYGRFGPKVTMDGAPVFATPDLFEPRGIRLADIDGSGTADIVYVGREGVSLYTNQSGNAWSAATRLDQFPATDDLTALATVDLKGNGTACLVWSSSLAADARRPMRYVELMSAQKPYLLAQVANNMGSVTTVDYAPSTKFYLEDRLAGRPWVTRLPFPVHVVERVENRDLVSNTTLVSTYRYRHGYYDGAEREYRGFAYVEQRDVESVVGAFDMPPVVSKTWFHNGAFLEEGRIEAYFKDPSNHEFFTGDAQAAFLPDPDLPAGLTAEETREAARALKGSILRQEVYADDGSVNASLPYSVSEHSYQVTCLQPRGPNRHAAFFTHSSESLDYHYERNPADPRIGHALTLAVDDYGNVLKSVAIGYQRRAPAFDEQGQSLATLTESEYTNAVLEDDAYRTPLPAEVKTYELTAPTVAGANPLAFAAVGAAAAAASEIAYELQPTAGQTQKRLIGQLRTLYRKNDLSAFLPVGDIESLTLPGESYKLAFTPGLLDIFQVNVSPADLTATLTGAEAEYRNLDGDGRLWIPSGQAFYSPTPGDPAASELAFAQAHFFLLHRYQDPFGANAVVTYDSYGLLLAATLDAVGNVISAQPDYRVLQPQLITDPNGNRTEIRFDALGMLAGTAVSGTSTGPAVGDSFGGFTADLAPAEITAFFASTNPAALAVLHLGTATTRIVYDLERLPVSAASIARETHVSDLATGAQSTVQLQFVYSDGFGRKAQTKVQAEPGPLDLTDPNSPLANPRWIGTGEKVYNNKGKPIREYEPFFSAGPQFGIETWGVSSTLFYDAVGRGVAKLHPNKTFEKVAFDPWRQTVYDVNDTVTFDPKTDPDVGDFFSQLPDADYLPTWYTQRASGALGPDEQDAAAKAAVHANTPGLIDLDTLGRTFLTIADNGKDQNGAAQQYPTRLVLDIEGNQSAVIDALGRVVMRYDYDMLGVRIHQASMESGERWTLGDVAGKPIRGWNSRKYAFSTQYDALRRSVRSLVQGGDPSDPNAKVFAQPIVYERTIYGDSADTGLTEAQQQQANLKTKVFKHFDSAGVITTDLYDFKGNSLHSARQHASDYQDTPDWSQNPALDAETFAGAVTYDALNRPVAVTAPDNSVYRPTFNDTGLLDQVTVNLLGAAASTAFVAAIEYDAQGRRTLIAYGNGAKTQYAYDPLTFRLTDLKTTRAAGQNGTAAQIFADPTVVQALHYTYDPRGNVTRAADAALITAFNGQKVDPVSDYTYDPLYRLTDAKGREHVGQSGFNFAPPDGDFRDYPFVGASALNDLQQLRNYAEHYVYDAVGNFQTMAHAAGNGAGNWTRTYAYHETSLLEAAQISNRLSKTALQTGANPPVETYGYDAHGNMTRMPHLPLIQWDFKDALSATSRQVVNEGAAETTYYVYDSSGQRARKVTQGPGGGKKNERFYIGGFEAYREYASGTSVALERQTLHVMDDRQRIALIETQTVNNGAAISSPTPTQRYQLANHLGSACLELDENGGLISYEEYSPYGGTTFQAGRSAAEVSLKRYRYTGMERDEENGFTYHGARYSAPWLGRWTSADPSGLTEDGPNLYIYARNDPITYNDPTGLQGDDGELQGAKTAEENDDRHKRLLGLYDVLQKKRYSQGQIEDDIFSRDAFKGDLDVLRNYGFKEFSVSDIGNPRYTYPNGNAKDYQDRIMESIQYYDTTWQTLHKISVSKMSVPTEPNRKEALQKLMLEGAEYMSNSVTAGVAWAYSLPFTDDPVKQTAAAGAGALAGNIFEAMSGFAKNLAERKPREIEGTDEEGRRSSFNPGEGTKNCVNCAIAFLRSVQKKELVTTGVDYAENLGSIVTANNHIAAQAEVDISSKFQFRTLETGKDIQYFIVYPGSSRSTATHVVIGINNKGNTMIYDPQNHIKYFDISKFGPFVAFPVSPPKK
jgi:RHS repeat-associated protein